MSGRTPLPATSRGLPIRPAVSVDELKRAWCAVQSGDFRRTPRPVRQPAPNAAHLADPVDDSAAVPKAWVPAAGERVVAVVGAVGSVGASAVALGLAMAAAEHSSWPVRVVECCPPTRSGLAAASTAELGDIHSVADSGSSSGDGAGGGGVGWRQGRRDRVLIERTTSPHAGIDPYIDQVPTPAPAEHDDQLTILDAGDATHLRDANGWLRAAVHAAPFLVLVTTTTVPAFRRLESALDLLDPLHPQDLSRIAVAVVGPVRRKWPRGVEQSAGPAMRRLLEAGRVVEVPRDRSLAVNGIDSRPLPRGLLAASGRLLDLSTGLSTSLAAPVLTPPPTPRPTASEPT